MNEQKTPIVLQAVYSYVAASLLSILLSPIFGKAYVMIFNPDTTGGLSGHGSLLGPFLLQSAVFAFPLFLPILVFILVSKKQWLVWLIGVIVPFTMFLSGGSKYILWFVIFTVIGGIIGWLISLLMKKLKKA